MDDLIRRAALRAAAKATLWVSLAGCGGTVRVDDVAESEPDPEQTTEARPDETPTNETPPDRTAPRPERPRADAGAPNACGAPSPGAIRRISEETWSCCAAELAPLFEPGTHSPPSFEDQVAAIVADPDLAACCNAVALFANANWEQASTMPWEEVMTCCYAADSPAGPACTPWGPPMPPKMPAHLGRLLEVA